MKLKVIAAIVIVLAVIGGLYATKMSQFKTLGEAQKNQAWPAETVSSAVVREEKWQDMLHAIGSITAVQGVTIMPEVSGTVTEIAFEPGAMVEKGDLLVRLDSSSEAAQLRAAEAQADLARINAERDRELRKGNTVSQSELDTAEATLKQLEGNADAIRSAIAKKTIVAPFAGQVGIRTVSVGEYLGSGTPIVSLQALSSVYANFSEPQQELGRLQTNLSVRIVSDAYPDHRFDGKLTAVNPDLDASTRNVRVQATLDNPEHLLRPGMFARIEVLLPTEKPVIIIPATAVLSAPYGDMVYVLDSQPGKDGKPMLIARQQLVRTGRGRGDFVSVEAGLKPGEKVASSGVFKLRNGMPVVENNELAPPASETPKPSDS